MRRIVTVAVLMVVISALVGATGAGAQEGSSEKDEKQVLRIGSTNDIDGFNPFKIVEIPSFEVMDLTYDLLVDFSTEDSSPVPGLADSWETSEDGLTWTFHLNEDAKWHDGEDVTSEDVAYTFNRILDEEQGLYIDYVRQIDSIETPDEHTVVFKTKDPSVQMLSMAVYVLPKHIWEDVPSDETKSFENEPAIGTGPFRAVEWREGQFARLEANPDYFKGSPHIDEIVVQFYDNDDTMVQAFRNGEVDYIAWFPINLFKSLDLGRVLVVVAVVPELVHFCLNLLANVGEGIDRVARREPGRLDVVLSVKLQKARHADHDTEHLSSSLPS